jgi:hypothetical protein
MHPPVRGEPEAASKADAVSHSAVGTVIVETSVRRSDGGPGWPTVRSL